MRWTVGTRVVAGFGAVIAVCAAAGVIAYSQQNRVAKDATSIGQTCLEPLTQLSYLVTTCWQLSLVPPQYVNADGAAQAELDKVLADQRARLATQFDAYDRLAISGSGAEARAAVDAWLAEVDKLVAAAKRYDVPAATDELNNKVNPLCDRVIEQLQALQHQNGDRGAEAVAAIDRSSQRGRASTLSGLVVAACLAVGVALVLSRWMRRSLVGIANQLSQGAVTLSGSSTEMSRASRNLSEEVRQQATSLARTTTALNELRESTSQSAETASEAARATEQARAAADVGGRTAAKVSDVIASITRATAETANIIRTIDEIAFQTNLLALNAAVEAARAGEAGRGFAVVADEVRNLAMRSGQAAKCTAERIEQAVGSSEAGVTAVKQLKDALDAIIDSSGRVNGFVDQIFANATTQLAGITQIVSTVRDLDAITRNSEDAAVKSAGSARQLENQAQDLSRSVQVLRSLTDGRAAA